MPLYEIDANVSHSVMIYWTYTPATPAVLWDSVKFNKHIG